MSSPVELKSASQLLALLKDGSIGAVELLDLLLVRCEQSNPAINAVVAFDIDGARDAAKAADNLAKSERRALHGLPMTIKDSYEVVGMTATCGFPHLANHRPQSDADAVALLRSAGAVFYGKTNLPFAASDHQSYNDLYGTTNNPWDLSRTPGGSSGGAAAAVAAGLTPLELGSDIAGSIRTPCHYCGVYGHKPSFNLVSSRGHIPPMPGATGLMDLAVYGPIARSAFDLELAMDVLAAPRAVDAHAWSAHMPPSRHESLSDFRVALWAHDIPYPVDSRCLEAMHTYAEELRRLGVQVDETARPQIDPGASDNLYIAMLFAVVSSGMPDEDVQTTIDVREEFGPEAGNFPQRIADAMRMSYARYLQLREEQGQLRAVWQRFFDDYDLILCPVMPTVAPHHDHSGDGPGHIAQYNRKLIVDGRPVPYLHGLQWPGLVSIVGLPATAMPTGEFVDGMPVGLQAVGPWLEDRTPIRFAQLLEQALGSFNFPSSVKLA